MTGRHNKIMAKKKMNTYMAIHKNPRMINYQWKMSHQDSNITINDTIVEQMNMAQINIDSETGEEVREDCPESSHLPSNHRFNLIPRPIKRNTKYTML